MSKKLWQKNWQLNSELEAFETGDDLALDQQFVWADVAGSLAQAVMLEDIGIITEKELKAAKIGLLEIQNLAKQGKFILAHGDEDVHTKIENYLTQHVGMVGKKIHTGRSRNDQVATALRLYTKYELLDIWKGVLGLAGAFLMLAKQYEYLPMPGYTHMQKAMPSSVGMWAGAFAESLLDDLMVLKASFALVDQSPLGSAAGYGVPIPLDRAFTAKLLGFSRVQNNSLYCQNSRGKTESTVVSALVSIGQTVNKFVTDTLLFTTSEFGYFTVADELTTGSSIMPQKKNIDIAELLRSKSHILLGHYYGIIGISGNLPSGYNRDFQDMKKSLFESLKISKQSIAIATLLVTHMTPNKEKLAMSMTSEIFATHQAFSQVKQGVPFRDAYAHASVGSPPVDLSHVLKQSTHIGGTGNLGLSVMKKHISKEHHQCLNAHTQFITAMARLGVDPVSTG